MRKVFLILMMISLWSCGGEKSQEEKTSSKSYTYSINDNGCKTGEHSFGSKYELCLALKDDELNNQCAYYMRLVRYEDNKCEELIEESFN